MKAFFYLILTVVVCGACASSVVEKGAAEVSLTKYAVGFKLYDRKDSVEVVIGEAHFNFAKAEQKNKFIISSSTQLTFLKELNGFDKITGLFDRNIFDEELFTWESRIGKWVDFKSSASPDWEGLSMHQQSIILGYKHFPLHENTAENLNLNIVPINEYMEA
ncbi:MAG: hypothetical protein NT150_02725, partial [Bacteroidetes bacterium]|nr:hypothetical protein [Bacteroidota bacterium]